MLILTRKLNDSLLIEIEGQSEPIEIKVTELGMGQVRLGFTAPKSCKIWREELYQTVLNNRQAASSQQATQAIRGTLRKKIQEKGTE